MRQLLGRMRAAGWGSDYAPTWVIWLTSLVMGFVFGLASYFILNQHRHNPSGAVLAGVAFGLLQAGGMFWRRRRRYRQDQEALVDDRQ
jgi:hypothetical protein